MRRSSYLGAYLSLSPTLQGYRAKYSLNGAEQYAEKSPHVLTKLFPIPCDNNPIHLKTRECLQPSTADTPQGPSSSPPPSPQARCCPTCLRSVLCHGCAARTGPTSTSTSTSHDRAECQALVGLSALQREQPGLGGSLLGGGTIYLRFADPPTEGILPCAMLD